MATYPIPVFHFQVEWGGNRIGFTEVSGLDQETQPIEYREGSNPNFFATKMPGMMKYGQASLKRGVIKGDNDFVAWFTTVNLNTVERRDLTVSLLNENHEPVMVWNLRNSFITKLTGVSLNSTGNEVAVEAIDVCFEQLTTEVLA